MSESEYPSDHPKAGGGDEGDSDDDDDELTEGEKERRSRWLAAGGQDHRLTIWELMDFRKSSVGSEQ